VSQAHDFVDQAIRSVDDLRRQLARGGSRLVRASAELALVKATCLAWFNSTRPELDKWDVAEAQRAVDEQFEAILRLIDKSSARSTYIASLKELKRRLATLRLQAVRAKPRTKAVALEPPPDFSVLIADARMQAILVRRWQETTICLTVGASLAATVMMGGVLEGLLLARLNLMPNKGPAFTASRAPRDKQGKTLPLKEWTLHNYLEVAHELKWIGTPAKDIGSVLRDWRNFIHPAKEFSEGASVDSDDASMLWAVFVQLSKQVLASARIP
jgi:hypothetical protein